MCSIVVEMTLISKKIMAKCGFKLECKVRCGSKAIGEALHLIFNSGLSVKALYKVISSANFESTHTGQAIK